AAVAARLKVLGFSVPDPRGLPDSSDPMDPVIISSRLDGSPPWLAADQPVPLEHVVAGAVATRRSPAAVAARLKVLGFSVPDPRGLPDSSDPMDPVIMSRDLDGVSPWLAADKAVPLGHVISAAARTGKSPDGVVARLKVLGFSVPDLASLPGTPDPGDSVIISRDLDGVSPWLAADKAVPLGHVISAAARTGKSPAAVVARLRALGYSAPDLAGVPDSFDSVDRIIISRGLDGVSPWLSADEAVPLGHVIVAVVRVGCNSAVVVARLRALGFSVPDLAGVPDSFDSVDQVIISRGLDGVSPWLAADEAVSFDHVVAAAVATGRSPAVVVARLRALGFSVPDPAGLLSPVDFTDLTVISRDLDGVSPWLAVDEPVPLGHVVAAAMVMRQSPAVVVARLRALGLSAPDPGGLPGDLDPTDRTIVSVELNDGRPWLATQEPVSPVHVIAAASETRRSPAEVAMRLVALGFTLSPLIEILDDPESLGTS
ncbi:wHTH domain-containing protein, partial [Microbispora bryophytorum]|uniref:wHTH domain-containing protein n=1 Tax=Microbispora bryophytorum TaxID=1460882 RepID=UPI00340DFFCE